ncbi:MAG TPA: aminoacyl-tRNA hydrolase [Dehalococcoidia bacterium]|jgi:PTH1 family peptidyl-tRNA hydrolase|nr:aminoacyl-tRNA hydrolase [Chloroflexota bacterium]HCE75835.1 aminoacyl-tRNA hydrolase [Dehalococcoidia bacterium]|tara:strand:- start:5345 stop:5920 length:576 start_codon:yes stop_codon:yes gene_type:complete
MDLTDPRLVILGIGNPGPKYQETRHNVGFWVIDLLIDNLNLELKRSHKSTLAVEGFLADFGIVVAKPRTYVNLSGESAAYLISRYSISSEKLLVVYDDIHIKVGNIKLRASGSAGGHNGVRSIINCLGTQEFPRLRIGVGIPEDREDQIGHVLGVPPREEKEAILRSVDDAVECIETLLLENIAVAMNRFN